MSRSSRKKENRERSQKDRENGMRRWKREEKLNGDDNDKDNDTQFKDRNSRKEDYRM